MVETASQMIPLGTIAPDFKLLDANTGQIKKLQDLKSNIATVVMFICNHCPYVKHIHRKLLEVIETYQAKNISFIAISSNDADTYPQDGFDEMKKMAHQFNYSFPYLYDETQVVAKAYHAVCTPDFFIFDKDLHCVYRGCFDESTPGNGKPITGTYLVKALENILQNKPVDANQKPSLGCNIKWKD